MKDKPQVGAFVNYLLHQRDKVIKGVGYFPAPAAKLTEMRTTYVNSIK